MFGCIAAVAAAKPLSSAICHSFDGSGVPLRGAAVNANNPAGDSNLAAVVVTALLSRPELSWLPTEP